MWILFAMSIAGRLGMVIDQLIISVPKYAGLKVSLPETVNCEPLKNQKSHMKIWVDRFNNMVIFDKSIRDLSTLQELISDETKESQKIIPLLVIDERADAIMVNRIIIELQYLGFNNIYFQSLPKLMFN